MQLVRRMVRALMLESALYEEVEHDVEATKEAAIIVIAVSILGALGTFFAGGGIGGLIGAIVHGLIGWILWSLLIYFIGTAIFKGQANMGEMLRALGFAYVPFFFMVIPFIGWIIGLVWGVIAMVVAARQGLDVKTWQAVVTVILGFIGYVIGVLIMGLIKTVLG